MTPKNSPFPPSSRVAAYLRDSGGDAQDLSVPQQERAVWEWCEDHKLTLKTVFKDTAAPGSSVVGREGFQAMIDHFRGRAPEKGLVIWSYARFSRSIDDAQFFLADLRRRGVAIHSMTDHIPEGTVGKLIEAAVIWKNQDFLETLSREVKRGQHDLIKDRGALGGTPPRGFTRQAVELGRRRDGSPHIVHKWVIDPEQAAAVRLAFEMKAAGASTRRIHETTRLYRSIGCYTTFFANRLYIGEMAFGETVIEDYVEPIVDRAIWEKVQAMRKPSTPRVHPRRASSRWLLSGLAYCALCGAPLNSSSVPSKSGDPHDYYACSREQRHAGCDARKVPKDLLESLVIGQLVEYLAEPEMAEAVRRTLKASAEEAVEVTADQIRQINQRLSGVRARISNILNALETAPGSEALTGRLLSLEGEERDLRQQVRALEIRAETAPAAGENHLVDRMQSMLANVNEWPEEDVRTVLAGLVSKVSVARAGKKVTGMVEFYEVPKLEIVNNEFL